MTNQIANAIYQQLGGGRFVAMTGTKGFVWDEAKQTLRMALTRNGSKANRLDVIYNPDDTYTMRFFHYTPARFRIDHKKCTYNEYPEKITEVKKFEHIYCDQLQELFTDVTKMYLTLY